MTLHQHIVHIHKNLLRCMLHIALIVPKFAKLKFPNTFGVLQPVSGKNVLNPDFKIGGSSPDRNMICKFFYCKESCIYKTSISHFFSFSYSIFINNHAFIKLAVIIDFSISSLANLLFSTYGWNVSSLPLLLLFPFLAFLEKKFEQFKVCWNKT